MPVELEAFVGHGILDPGNIVEPGAAPAFAMGEHHLLELFGGAGLGKRAHTEFALSRFGFQPPAGQLGVFVPDRPEDIGRAQANRLQLRREEVHILRGIARAMLKR